MNNDQVWQAFLFWFAKEYAVEYRTTVVGLRESSWRAYRAGYGNGYGNGIHVGKVKQEGAKL